jgi:hypothetical protein
LIVALNWMSEALFGVFQRSVAGEAALGLDPWSTLAGLGVFPVLASVLFIVAKRSVSNELKIYMDNRVYPQALVMFLSPHASDRAAAYYEAGGPFRGRVSLADPDAHVPLEEMGRDPWRMPLEAIRHSLVTGASGSGTTLRRIAVITSADAVGEAGTWRQAETFVRYLESVLPASSGVSVTVHPSDGEGVDFEDARALWDAVDRVVDELVEGGGDPERILIDVTGGSKVASIVGAVSALGQGRHFQYISRRDYVPHAYDITPAERAH